LSLDKPVRLPDSPLKKTRRSAVARVLGWLFGLSFLTAIALGGFGMWSYATYTAPGPLKQPRVVDIAPGTDRGDIASLLYDNGVIADPFVMGLATFVQRLRGARLKAGEYEFPANASMAEVFNIMASGRVVMHKLTVPEGWTTEMAVTRMREHEAMSGNISVVPAEGQVIANTYLFARGKDRQAMLDEMVTAQQKLLDSVWAKKPATSIIKSKAELLTLASIVEKETAKPEERPLVAAVFLNRLKAGMRLQSDPTIIYGIVGGKGKLDRPISQADIDGETPYNTYRINGLPPGPIATPGKDSLEAVINPAQTDALYFVADGTGGHVFAATLEEHNANVVKWRAIENGTTQPPPTPAATGEVAAAPVTAPPADTTEQLPNVAEEVAVPAAAEPASSPPEAGGAAIAQTGENVVAEAQAAEQPAAPPAKLPKPGSMVKVGKVLVPIPKLKESKSE
jgi:UPF0755 protein